MIRHDEDAGSVEGVRLVEVDNAFRFEVDYATRGGIRKSLRLGEADAHYLYARLADAIAQAPREGRLDRMIMSLAEGCPE